MKKQILGLTLALSLTSTSFAACLDSKPASKKELEREIRITTLDIAVSKENQNNFASIALSARKRNNLAKMVASGSTLPLAFVLGGAIGSSSMFHSFLNGLGQVPGLVASFAVILGPVVADGAVTVSSLRDMMKKQGISEQDINDLIREVEVNSTRGCSYQEAFVKIDELRDQVFETDLDGSLKNQIRDHVTLGSLSRRATEKLFQLAAYKTILQEQKLKDLKKIKI